ncbi:MAG: DUF748 domain-containing protein [Bacteroidia bacterium]
MQAKRILKIFLIVFSAIFILVFLCIIFISPITKYLIEKYDEKYTGRQITLDWAYVNPFTGYVYLSNVKAYEQKSDSVFLSANGIGANFEVRKLFSKEYEISTLTFERLKATIIQNGNKHNFNFDDIINKFRSGDKDTAKAPVHFSILHFNVNSGELYYRENAIPVNYFIKKVNLDCEGVKWNNDTIKGKFSFESGMGTGDVKGNITMNKRSLDYNLTTIFHKYDLNILEQYMKDFSNYGRFRANMDADIIATGNFNRAREVEAKGKLAINDFHFGKNATEDFASFQRFSIGITDLSPHRAKYIFDSVFLDKVYFKYELYDHLDNIQTMFGKKGQNVKDVHNDTEHFNLILEIADYVKKLAQNFFRSYYNINHLEVRNGDFVYNDYSLNEKFTVAANPFNIKADSVSKKKQWVRLVFKTGIKPYGNAAGHLIISPKDSSDFDLAFRLEGVPLTIFNPYLTSYTSYPLNRGSVQFKAAWHVRNGNITSENHLILLDPRTTHRVKRRDLKWIPVPLIMAFVREQGNVIDYEIPVTGNIKKPTFHWRDVITDLLRNIFIKPPTTPYRVVVKNVEREIEKSIKLDWQMNQYILTDHQQKFMRHLGKFLKKNPEVVIEVQQMEYSQKEKEYILFYEAKKKFFLLSRNKKPGSFGSEDSLEVIKMTVKDPEFVKFMNGHVASKEVFTVQEKCAQFVGNHIVTVKYNELIKKRKEAFLAGVDNDISGRIKIHPHQDVVPYNGFSFFKINYKGNMPESLIKAYNKLQKLNEEAPRDKYFDLRKKTPGTFD